MNFDRPDANSDSESLETIKIDLGNRLLFISPISPKRSGGFSSELNQSRASTQSFTQQANYPESGLNPLADCERRPHNSWVGY
jgi:hypothetical protein